MVQPAAAAPQEHAHAPQTILRVKRKRNDDPADAFFFQYGAVASSPQSKRRPADTHRRGVFRFAETLPGADVLDATRNAQAERAPRIIDAEWDAKRHRVALKRKRDRADAESGPAASPPHAKRTQREAQDTQGGDAEPSLAQFSSMLQEYLQLNEIDTRQEDKVDAAEYVYDIYYRDVVPPDWTPPQRRAESSPRPAVPAHPQTRAPPVVGRAKSSADTHSPVPLRAPRRSTTSAPGFEHLAPEEEDDFLFDEWETGASFTPIFSRHTQGAVPAHAEELVEEEIAPAPTLEDDEDSNEEDFYRNDYPDQDEWGSEEDE